MVKRLAVLVAMLAMMMGTALPALAESEPQLTGVIEEPEVTSYMYGTHAMTDEVGGDLYALQSEVVDLDAYVGQRVTVFGASVPEYENGQVEGGPPLFEVTRVESAGGPTEGDGITATFELAAECEPPRVRRSTASSGSNRRSSPTPTATVPTRASLRSRRTSAPSQSRWRS